MISEFKKGMNLNKIRQFFLNPWVYGVGSAVLAVLILRVLDHYAHLAIIDSIFKFLKNVLDFFNKNHELKLWVLIVLCLTPLGIAILVLWVVSLFQGETEPEFTNYISDTFFDINWHWRWLDNSILESSLLLLCPNCSNELQVKDTPFNDIKSKVYCEHCGFSKKFRLLTRDLVKKVLREIRRRI